MKRKFVKSVSAALLAAMVFTGCQGGGQETADTQEKEATEQSADTESQEDKEPADKEEKKEDSDKSSEFNAQFTFNGSSTLAPVISAISTEFIEEYEKWNNVNPDMPEENISIFVSSGGSGAGAKSVIDGTSDFGMLAREIKDEEKEKIKDLKEYKLGIDALTVSVNPENPIIELKNNNLTQDEIVKIFSGEFKKWSDIDSSLPQEDIVVVTRDLSGGAHEVFQKKIMGDTEVSENAIQAPSMGALVTKIIENPNAIGYASYGMVNQNEGKLKPMNVDGVEPTEENIVSGEYIISRPLIVMRSGEPTESEQAFLDYVMSEKGKAIIKEMGFVPVDK